MTLDLKLSVILENPWIVLYHISLLFIRFIVPWQGLQGQCFLGTQLEGLQGGGRIQLADVSPGEGSQDLVLLWSEALTPQIHQQSGQGLWTKESPCQLRWRSSEPEEKIQDLVQCLCLLSTNNWVDNNKKIFEKDLTLQLNCVSNKVIMCSYLNKVECLLIPHQTKQSTNCKVPHTNLMLAIVWPQFASGSGGRESAAWLCSWAALASAASLQYKRARILHSDWLE